jgi:hypothetical protein
MEEVRREGQMRDREGEGVEGRKGESERRRTGGWVGEREKEETRERERER